MCSYLSSIVPKLFYLQDILHFSCCIMFNKHFMNCTVFCKIHLRHISHSSSWTVLGHDLLFYVYHILQICQTFKNLFIYVGIASYHFFLYVYIVSFYVKDQGDRIHLISNLTFIVELCWQFFQHFSMWTNSVLFPWLLFNLIYVLLC